jgi:hypothetical protein
VRDGGQIDLDPPACRAQTPTVRRIVYLLAAWFVAALAARAQFITPVSYTENSTGSTGEFTYFDTTPPSKLTDGVLGADSWQADLGNGPAAEWVGWDNGVIPSLVFTFTGSPTINQVQVGFNRAEDVSIFLPSAVTINGTVFPVAANAIPNDTRAFLDFNGPWTGNTITVNLSDIGSEYAFVDEVQFAGAAGIPEPQTYATVLGLLTLVAAVWRRRKISPA